MYPWDEWHVFLKPVNWDFFLFFLFLYTFHRASYDFSYEIFISIPPSPLLNPIFNLEALDNSNNENRIFYTRDDDYLVNHSSSKFIATKIFDE